MRPISPFPWKPILLLLCLVAMLAGIVRLFLHDWARGSLLLVACYGLFRLGLWLWPPPGDKPGA